MGISTRLDAFSQGRKANYCKQFSVLFGRNWDYLLRNPQSLRASMFQAVFVGLLVLGMYWHIGSSFTEFDQVFKDNDVTARYQQYIGNLSGCGFILVTNTYFALASSVLLQLPMQVPVYKRERANDMYLPSTYYFGRFISHTILQIFYPVVMTFICLWGLNLDTSFENVFYITLYGVLTGLVSIGQGWFCGALANQEIVAQMANSLVSLLFMLSSGGLGSAS